jgi:hypothetical protein
MEDVLKYQRLQGAIDSIVAKDRITASALESNFLVVGTERGIIHILSLTGIHIQKYVPHPGRAIRGLSLCFDGSLMVYSCAQDDDTVVQCSTASDELRTTTFHFSETITAIAVDYTSTAYKNDGMFLVGTQSGRLIKYRPSVLFGKKEKRIEDGKDSPVKAIAWQENLVAWADDEGLYLFDISTKSAIGRVPTPCGPGDRDVYPVTLRWTDVDQLLLGWAYTVTVLKVKSSAEEGLLTEAGSLVVKIVHSWETDCVVAGLQAFDRDHLVYLGYSTLSAEEMADGNNADGTVDPAVESVEDAVSGPLQGRTPGANADLEVVVAKIHDGDIVSADVLPLHGNLYLSQGPFQFQLLSSYDTRTLLRDPPHRQWQLHNYSENRGDQGIAPLLFVASPEDIVIGRVRDVNDRVRAALGQGDLKLAVDVAQYNRASLHVYNYADLLEGYIMHLLGVNETGLAAKEIARLAGMDAILWETWVYRFIKMGLLDYLCMELPIHKPRLERIIYEEVLENLIQKHPDKLLPTLQIWAQSPTALYDRDALIQKLERSLRLARRVAMTPVDVPLSAEDTVELLHMSVTDEQPNSPRPLSAHLGEDGILSSYRHTQEAKWRRQKRREARHAARHYFAALAHLHLINKNYEKALNSYLHRLPRTNVATTAAAAAVAGTSSVGGSVGGGKGGTAYSISTATGAGGRTTGGRRETSVSTLTASDAARQVQAEQQQQQPPSSHEALSLPEDEDFEVESEEDSDSGDEALPSAGGMGFPLSSSPARERRHALDETGASGDNAHSAQNNVPGMNHSQTQRNNINSNSEHRHVFELIEREHLFHNIAGKIRYLVRLSKPLCQRLLLSHLDKLPIGSVAAQLQSDRDLLRWYLTALFADPSARETYRAKEFSQLHLKQLQLSIEHRARSVLIQHMQHAAAGWTSAASTDSLLTHSQSQHQQQQSNELLQFLKAGWIPVTVALQEIDMFLASSTLYELFNTYVGEASVPISPTQLLCEEKVYLLAMQGEKQSALRLLLETDDVDRVLYFLTVHGHGHAARYLPPSSSSGGNGSSSHRFGRYSEDGQDDEFHQQQQHWLQVQQQQKEGHVLWEEVVRRALESPVFLHRLVTRLGDSGMDGTVLLRRLSEHVEHIPHFRQKISQVMSDWRCMDTLDRSCRALQQEEALTLLAQKNMRQRRAIKIEARSSTMQRCTICLRPLGTESAPPSLDSAMLLLNKTGGANELQLPCAPSAIALCGVQHLQHHHHYHHHQQQLSLSSSSSSSSGQPGGAGSGGGAAPSHHSLLFFNAKTAVHHRCFESILRAELESKRVADESKELLGTTSGAMLEKRGMVARTHHTQVHR